MIYFYLKQGQQKTRNKRLSKYQNNTIETLLEPCHGVLLFDAALEAHTCVLLPPSGNTSTRAAHYDIEIHAEDTDTGVVSCAEIDVLLDAKAKVARFRKIATAELVLLDFET